MAGNGMIRMLRGTSEMISNSGDSGIVLEPGQPLYNTDKNYLTIGGLKSDGDKKRVDASPISVRELKGWWADQQGITSSISPFPDFSINHISSNIGDTSGVNILKIRTRNSAAAISLEATGSSLANKTELLLYDGNISAKGNTISLINPNKEALIFEDGALKGLMLGNSGELVSGLKIGTNIIPSIASSSTEGIDMGALTRRFKTIYANRFEGEAAMAQTSVLGVSPGSGNTPEVSAHTSISKGQRLLGTSSSKNFRYVLYDGLNLDNSFWNTPDTQGGKSIGEAIYVNHMPDAGFTTFKLPGIQEGDQVEILCQPGANTKITDRKIVRFIAKDSFSIDFITYSGNTIIKYIYFFDCKLNSSDNVLYLQCSAAWQVNITDSSPIKVTILDLNASDPEFGPGVNRPLITYAKNIVDIWNASDSSAAPIS